MRRKLLSLLVLSSLGAFCKEASAQWIQAGQSFQPGFAQPVVPAPPGAWQVPVPRQVDPWYAVDPMYGVHHWAATTRPFPNAAMRPLPEGSTYAVEGHPF